MRTMTGQGKGAGRLIALAVAVGLVVSMPARGRAQEEVVKLGDLFAISNAAIYIAIEKGYFKEQGIRNEIANFASAAKMLPALTAGEIEVSVGTASAGLFNAIAAGAPYRIVADKGQARAGSGYVLLAVRKDLVDSGQVKGVKDLKGKKVALFAKGIIQDYLMGKMAEEAGLTIKDFDITYLGAPSQLTALETKAIDAAQTVEPWGSRFEERAVAVKFRTPDQVKGLTPVQIACIMYSGKFINERRDVAQRWMNAYLKAARLFAERGTKDDELAAIIAKYTKNPVNVVKAAIPHYQAPDGKLVLESLSDQIKWFVANGYMKEPVPIEKAVDLTFLK
jgi:NitT/TauT family transport system substrate-binding protein